MKFRLGLKKAYEKLQDKDKNEFFDNMRALNNIDPFRYAPYVVLLMLVVLLVGFYNVSVIIGVAYIVWSSLYFVTFLGVYFMWKQKIKRK